MKSMLQNTREKFGSIPRTFSFTQRIYNKVRKQPLMKYDTRFDSIYKDQKFLFSNGNIVWGHIVQANTLLFKEGIINLPAAVVFSVDSYYDDNLDELGELANLLYDLKGSGKVDKHFAEFAEVITNEMTALYNIPIPKSVTNGRLVYYTTIMVFLKHLPLRYLNNGWFPLLIKPFEKKSSLILPSKYWAEDLIKLWCEQYEEQEE